MGSRPARIRETFRLTEAPAATMATTPTASTTSRAAVIKTGRNSAVGNTAETPTMKTPGTAENTAIATMLAGITTMTAIIANGGTSRLRTETSVDAGAH